MKKRNPKEMPLMDKEELLSALNILEKTRDRALVSSLYLTGARISEIVRKLRKNQIKIRGKFLIVEGVPILKRREKEFLKRNIPINMEKERPFVNIFLRWYESCPTPILFNISRIHAWRIINKVGLFPHYLRHLRLSHLVTEYGFNSSELRHFTGWKEETTASWYVHLRTEDLMRKME